MRAALAYIPPLLLLAGCSSRSAAPSAAAEAGATPDAGVDVIAAPVAVSGARLRARWYTTSDGARHFAGWHDKDRAEDCAFTTSDDGTLRCLPVATSPAVVANAFADASCTKPAVAVSPDCATPYVYEDRVNGPSCVQPPVLWRKIFGATKLTGSAYTRSASCQPLTATVAFYALGDPVAPTSFVDARETTDPGEGLVARYLVASDGARELVGWKLTKLGVSCSFQVMKDGATRCLPAEPAGVELYTDSSCSAASFVQLADYGTNPSCANASFWVRRDASAGACEPPSDVVAIGNAYSGSAYQKYDYGPTSTSCTLRLAGAGLGVYAFGASLGASLPAASARVSAGGARLVPALVASPGAAGVPTRDLTRGWHDTHLDVDCSFAVASDGKIRCLPVSAAATLFYGDSACQGPTRLAGFSVPACGSDPRYALEVSPGCSPTMRVWNLGTVTDVSAGSASNAGHCVQLPLKNVYTATPADPALFVEATLTVD